MEGGGSPAGLSGSTRHHSIYHACASSPSGAAMAAGRRAGGQSASQTALLAEALDRLADGLNSKAQALDAFRRVDTDGSGELSTSELKLALKFLDLHLSASQTGAIMLHLDKNQDGSISLDEFLTLVWANKLKLLRRKLGAAAYSSGGIDVEKLFRRYDKDHTGMLEYDDFRLVVRRDVGIVESDVPDNELQEMYEFVDSDGSGTISIDEFARLLPAHDDYHAMQKRYSSVVGQALNRIIESAEQRRENLMYLFHRIDADGSGGLSREEFRQATLALEVVLSASELDDLLGELDSDGKGYVTPQEFSKRLRVAKKDRRAVEGRLSATNPGSIREPDQESKSGHVLAPEPEPEPEPEPQTSSNPQVLRTKHAKKGTAVRLRNAQAMAGVIVKKAGKKAQVDFTQSGGALQWVPLTQLQQIVTDGAQNDTDGEEKRCAEAESDGLHNLEINRLRREVEQWRDEASRVTKLAAEEALRVGLRESNLRQEIDQLKGEAAAAASAAAEGAARASSLRHAPSRERSDRSVVMAAVAQDGLELQYAAEKLRADPEVVLTAASQRPDGSVLKYAAQTLLDDEEFLAVAQKPWIALQDLRTAECRLRAEQVTRLERQLREMQSLSTPRSERSSTSKAAIKRAERAAAERLAEQTSLREAAEYRANVAERKLRTALETAAQDDEAATGPPNHEPNQELLKLEKQLATEQQAQKFARRRMESASQAASKARRELSVALETNGVLQADLDATKRQLAAQEKEFKRAKTAFKKMVGTLEEDLATKSKLLEESHRSKQPKVENFVQAVDSSVAQIQIQWVGTLHQAIEAGDLSTVRTLLNSGHGARAAVIAQVDGTLAPMPLHRAIRKGNLDIFRRLTAEFTKAELPAVFNMQDACSGFSSLHVAVEYGHADIADAIIRSGCDTTLQNRRGKTAWQHAELLIGCEFVPCVDSIFHMHAVGKHACSQLELELAHQNDQHKAPETYSDPVEIDTCSLHSWSLDTFANWTKCPTSEESAGVFDQTYKVEGVFPAIQIGPTVHNTVVLRVARQSCKPKDLHDEVRKLGILTRNSECPSNIVKVLGIVYGCAQRDGPETFMMATECCPFSLLDCILPGGPLAQHYSPQFVLEQAKGIAWGLSYCHARGLVHLDLKLEHVKLKKSFGVQEESAFTAKIDGFINKAKFHSSGDSVETRNASDAVFGATDILQFGTLLVDMLTRTRNHPSVSQPLAGSNISPMLRVLVEACWHPEPTNRITCHEIHRLLHSIDAHVWMAESSQLDSQLPGGHVQFDADDSTQVAEAVPPEPNPTTRLLQLLDSEPSPAAKLLQLLEAEVVNYPYEMELLRRNLEGERLQSEHRLKEQLTAERHLNQLNRDRAVYAATAALSAELQAKTEEVDAVRRYGNRTIDILKETVLDIGGFSESQLAALVQTPSTPSDGVVSTDRTSMRREQAIYSRRSPQLYKTGGRAMDSQQQDHHAPHDGVHSTQGQRRSTVKSGLKSPVSHRPQSSPRCSMPVYHRQCQRSRALIDSLESLTTRTEQPLELVDRQDETDSTVLVACPDGCVSGDTVTFSIDADDDQIELDVIVPSGVVAGDEFEIQFDSGS